MAEVHKKKVDKSIAIMMLFFCFLISLVNLLINSYSSIGGFVWLILLILDLKKLSKLDFVLFGSIVVGIVLKFITIFYRNNYLPYVGNASLLIFSLLAIFIYFNKGMHHQQN